MKQRVIFLASLFFVSINIQGMKEQREALKIREAKEYNRQNPNITFIDNLIKVPSDPLGHIMKFQYCSEPLDEMNNSIGCRNFVSHSDVIEISENIHTLAAIEYALEKRAFEYGIKCYMRLSCVCTHFNKVLTPQTVGMLHKHYSLDQKNDFWQTLMMDTDYEKMNSKRMPALILICAGATSNIQIDELLTNIIVNNKTQQAEILFQHAIDPNLERNNVPIFFFATTVEMINLFKTYGVDIQAMGCGKNVLWHILTHNKYGPELMEFYLSENTLNTDGILHSLAAAQSTYQCYGLSNINILKKGDLLLKTFPKMVNVKDKYGRTPLDIAMKFLLITGSDIEGFDKRQGENQFQKFELFAREFIALFRKYNANTSLELKEEAERSDCILF